MKRLTTESTAFGLLIGSCLVATGALFYFTRQYAVNILFWDDWDTYQAVFQPHSWWEIFTWQNGVHRQGISSLFCGVLNRNWDSRVESFSIAGYLVASMVAAVILKKKALGSFLSTDTLIPFVVLTLTQMETVVANNSAACHACPLFLFMAYALAWTTERSLFKYIALSVLQFLLIFTGYGYAAVPVCLVVLLSDIHRAKGGYGFIALISLTGSIALFLKDYSFQPFTFTVNQNAHSFFDYVLFSMRMQSGFFGLENSPLRDGVGAPVLVILFLIFMWNLNQLQIASRNQSLILVLLSGFTIAFSLSTSVGRVQIGYASSSRYMTLLIPGMLAILFQISVFPKVLRFAFASLFLSLVGHGYVTQIINTEKMGWCEMVRVKQSWRDCYLKTDDAMGCTEKVGMGVYPDLNAISGRLQYLKSNHLNLFN